jgi:hypothetical protein
LPEVGAFAMQQRFGVQLAKLGMLINRDVAPRLPKGVFEMVR